MYRFLFLFLFLLSLIIPACAQDVAQPVAKEPNLDEAKTVADVEQYLESVSKKLQTEIQELAKKGEITADTIGPFLQKMSESSITGAEKILKIAKDEVEKKTGYQMLIQGLKQADQREKITQFEKMKKEAGLTKEDESNQEKILPLVQKIEAVETEAQKRLTTLYEEIEKEGKFIELISTEKFQQFIKKGREVYADFTLEKFEAYKKEALEWANKKIEGIPTERALENILELASSDSAQKIAPKLSEKVREELTAFVKSDQCTLTAAQKEEILGAWEGEAKRSAGAELKLYGKTLDDKDFDWTGILAKNRVVLVKFTATWCGPCKGEIPGMLEAYKKYHDKGFEIVSVYCWERGGDPVGTVKKAVEEEKLPWLIVSEALTEKAKQPAQGKFYGIQGVPTMLLVGKDGKVITEARGRKLQDELAELFK
ncbi:MAG: redoxin family protein [Planctomycetaceae bacterium]|jgi:thiol-disulfide isomerase/thioredoxin|nr:redoxin family protein [Planctomycetaceae bacterium]